MSIDSLTRFWIFPRGASSRFHLMHVPVAVHRPFHRLRQGTIEGARMVQVIHPAGRTRPMMLFP